MFKYLAVTLIIATSLSAQELSMEELASGVEDCGNEVAYRDRNSNGPNDNNNGPCGPKPCAPKPQCPPKPCKKECPPKPCPQPCQPKPRPHCKPKCVKPPCATIPVIPLPMGPNLCVDPCCPPITIYNRNVTPSARETLCNNDLFITADFLYWKPRESDFSLAFVQETFNTPTSGVNGEIVRFDFDWDPGFRLGLGWNTFYDGWDLSLVWTWFRGKTEEKESAAATYSSDGTSFVGIVPFWSVPSGTIDDATSVFSELEADWRLLLNMFDLEMGRDFFVSPGLSLRPHFGVEGGWINRKWSISYSGIPTPTTSSVTTIFSSAYYQQKSNFWGVGPVVGLNGDWRLGKGFRFLANLTGSFLSGQFNENEAEFSEVVLASHTLKENEIEDEDIWNTVPHLQLFTGIGWGTTFNCRKCFFELKAGWEANEYWHVPMLIYPDEAGLVFEQSGVSNRQNRSNNLSLSGLTVEARIDF